METLAIAYAYEVYEQNQGIEYELPDFYDFRLLPNAVWLASIGALILSSQMLVIETAIAHTKLFSEPIQGAIVNTQISCLNIRRAPHGDWVKCVPKGSSLKAIVQEENDWYQLANGNWVYKGFVKIPQSVPAPSTSTSCNQALLKYVAENLMQCDDIKVLQKHLNWYELLSEDLPVTGVFDLATKVAVETFQTKQKLTIDGIVGQETRQALKM